MSGAGTPAVEFRNVTKSFGRTQVLRPLSMTIAAGEFFSLLGPSGCGKTTSLRIIAGLERPDSGTVLLQGQDVTSVPAHRRNVNLVFQNYELFPHMSVHDNVAYGLRVRGVADREVRERVSEALALVQVSGLEGRGVRQLSGGQQQRVALARALVNRPAALLLDEPLSALDVKLRKQMQLELKAIQARLGTTFVYVTHDQEEALLLSDRIAVMHEGVIRQIGTPAEIYRRPDDSFVADFVGQINILRFHPQREIDGVAVMDVSGGRVAMRASAIPAAGSTLAVRPERVSLDPVDAPAAGADSRSRLPGRVDQVDYLGTTIRIVVATDLGPLTVLQLDSDRMPPREGDDVIATWEVDAAFGLANRPGANDE